MKPRSRLNQGQSSALLFPFLWSLTTILLAAPLVLLVWEDFYFLQFLKQKPQYLCWSLHTHNSVLGETWHNVCAAISPLDCYGACIKGRTRFLYCCCCCLTRDDKNVLCLIEDTIWQPKESETGSEGEWMELHQQVFPYLEVCLGEACVSSADRWQFNSILQKQRAFKTCSLSAVHANNFIRLVSLLFSQESSSPSTSGTVF